MRSRQALLTRAMTMPSPSQPVLAFALALAISVPAWAQEAVNTDIGTLDKATAEKVFPSKRPYSPYAGRNFPTRPLFGDTHVHTGMSFDAGAFGARLGPRDAYRFAKGEEVMASSGQLAKLSRPLDFLVVTDHSDNMGFFPDLLKGKPELLADPLGRKWYDMIQSGQGAAAAVDIITSFGAGKFKGPILYDPSSDPYRSAWHDTIDAAEEANEPGRFTAVIGYEWTSNTGGNNLHRNVLFRDNGDFARQIVPYTTLPPGSDNPRDLWKWMAAYEEKTGGDVLAIAHNGNLSNGIMFPMIEPGKAIDREYAETRSRWEHIYEVTQIKGDGETHPFLSPNDEFANFERWDKGNLDLTVAKKPEMLQFEYARSALMNGLKLEAEARGQSLQVRSRRFDGRAHRACDGRRRQLLRQDIEQRAVAGPRDASVREDGQGCHHGLGADGVGLRRGLGHGKHARGDLRRDGTARDLCHDRPAHGRALLRRLRLRDRRRHEPRAGDRRLHQGRADGWRPRPIAGRQEGAKLPGRRIERPDRRQSRPLPDRQGLARRQGRRAREGL